MSTEHLRRLALIVWTAIGVLLLSTGLVYAAVSVRFIWLPLALAVGVVIVLSPLVRFFVRRRLHRVPATILAFLAAAGALTGAGALILPTIGQQAADFTTNLPQLYDTVISWIEDAAAQLGFDLAQVWTAGAISDWLADPANQETIQQALASLGAGAGRLIFGVGEAAFVLLLTPVLAFYLLIDLDRFRTLSLELTPNSFREEVSYVGGRLAASMAAFVRGQLLIALIVAIMSSVGMWMIDLPFWLIVGIIAGITNLVPFVGPIFGSALGVLIALINGSVTQALLALIIFVVIQQIESQILTPVVQRTMVKMAPIFVLLAIIVGGILAGLLGVLVAVPVAVALRILIGHVWRTRVLGQSWREATEAMISVAEPPLIIRERLSQTRLFDTGELRRLDLEKEKEEGSGP